MRIASVIVAYNHPELATRLFCMLTAQTASHDVYLLDNSSDSSLVADTAGTIDLGRHNLGWGGCHEWFVRTYPIRHYDFVGFWNVDVTNVSNDMLESFTRCDLRQVGAFSPTINDEGTGWPFMRMGGSGKLREVPFLESIAWYCRPEFLLSLVGHSPLPFHGWWIDIVTAGYVKSAGMKCAVHDGVAITHLERHKSALNIGVELMGSKGDYNRQAREEAENWIIKSSALEKYDLGREGLCVSLGKHRSRQR